MKKSQNQVKNHDVNLDEQVQIFKALANPTRLFILQLLNKEGEMCVCKITEVIGYDISTVSKHLAVLRIVGLITSRKEKNMVFYKSLIPCLSEFTACFELIKPQEQ